MPRLAVRIGAERGAGARGAGRARSGARTASRGCSGTDPVRGRTLMLGILGAVYATVVAYTDLPLAWASWSASMSVAERLATAVGVAARAAHVAPQRRRQGGDRGFGVRGRADPLPRAARNRVGGDRARQLLVRPVPRRLHGVLLRDRARPEHVPERHLRGGLVEVHGLQRRRAVRQGGRPLLHRLQPAPRPSLPRRVPVRAAATATAGGSTATTSATASATRRSRARPRSCAGS